MVAYPVSPTRQVYPSPVVFAETLEAFHNKSVGWAFNTTFPNPYWWVALSARLSAA